MPRCRPLAAGPGAPHRVDNALRACHNGTTGVPSAGCAPGTASGACPAGRARGVDPCLRAARVPGAETWAPRPPAAHPSHPGAAGVQGGRGPYRRRRVQRPAGVTAVNSSAALASSSAASAQAHVQEGLDAFLDQHARPAPARRRPGRCCRRCPCRELARPGPVTPGAGGTAGAPDSRTVRKVRRPPPSRRATPAPRPPARPRSRGSVAHQRVRPHPVVRPQSGQRDLRGDRDHLVGTALQQCGADRTAQHVECRRLDGVQRRRETPAPACTAAPRQVGNPMGRTPRAKRVGSPTLAVPAVIPGRPGRPPQRASAPGSPRGSLRRQRAGASR